MSNLIGAKAPSLQGLLLLCTNPRKALIASSLSGWKILHRKSKIFDTKKKSFVAHTLRWDTHRANFELSRLASLLRLQMFHLPYNRKRTFKKPNLHPALQYSKQFWINSWVELLNPDRLGELSTVTLASFGKWLAMQDFETWDFHIWKTLNWT